MRLAETYLVIIKIYKHLKRTEEKILEPKAERGRINHFFKIGLQLPSNVVLLSAVQQSESAICIHISTLFKISSHLGHCRALSRARWATQSVFTSYLFYTSYCTYVNPNLQIHSTPFFPPWQPYICSLCLCLYFCFSNKFIYTIFSRFPYIYALIHNICCSLANLLHSV